MMRAAHTGRKLPPLSYRNSIDRLFGVVEAPTENMAWFDSIGDRLAKATAEMNAEREDDRLAHQLEQWRKAEQEQQDRVDMRDFQNTFGLGVGQ